jgi:DNA processing protein
MEIIEERDPRYNLGLYDLNDVPATLYARGDLGLLRTPSVAIVGARACTSYGAQVTSTLVSGLVAEGQTIISGGAYGIDAAAHQAALLDNGKTIVVLSGGVDRPYPAGHAHLFEDVLAHGGLIISEQPPGETPNRERFLARNRLIAAISSGVVVVEAGMQSGSLNTAHWARGLYRPLMAVPGPITSVVSRGTNDLLRRGAAVAVTSASEIMSTIDNHSRS